MDSGHARNKAAYSEETIKVTDSVQTESFVQSVVDRANSQARAGEYGEAESLLSKLVENQIDHPVVLDLLARIYAQQGQLGKAEGFWNRALQKDSSNNAYREGLAKIDEIRKRPAGVQVYWMSALTLGAVFLILLVSLLLLRKIELIHPTLPGELSRIAENQHEILNRMERIEKRLGSTQNIRKSSTTLFRVDVEGILVTTENGEAILTFEEGLFSSGDRLTDRGREILSRLGKQLEPYAGEIFLIVTGYTDDRPLAVGSRFSDNLSLGMARAARALEQLRQTSRLPIGIFSARSLGDTATPFPNDSAQNRSRNRTVSIRILTSQH